MRRCSSRTLLTMVFQFTNSTSLWAILGVVTLFIGIRRRQNRSRLPLPPGPKKLPLVGNLFDIPSERQWETYLQWSKEFSALVSHFSSPKLSTSHSESDIIHVEAAGTSIVILSSMEAIRDLFDKRSSLYSDRWATFVCILDPF
jgi:hypothetical protein